MQKIVPHGAIQGGRTSRGELLYIGRKIHAGVMVPGKIHPSLSSLYIAYDGKEHCLNKRERSLHSEVTSKSPV